MNPFRRQIPELSRGQIAAAVVRNDRPLLPACALSAAYFAEPAWAEAICVRLASHADAAVRRAALAGLEHLRRTRGFLSDTARRALAGASAENVLEAFSVLR